MTRVSQTNPPDLVGIVVYILVSEARFLRALRPVETSPFILRFTAAFDHFPVFLDEPANVRTGKQVQHRLGRPAELHRPVGHHDGPIDQDRVLEHLVDEFIVGPLRIIEPKLRIRRAFCRSKARTGMPIIWINAMSRSRLGGFLRYSMMCGSTPLWRIIARTLREVPQAGLW